ncbi:restriction endonuclease type II-like protein [Mortierella sp. GBAus27b]|nr:ssDNA endonuclease and repair protein rad10 [Mortierella sp. GBA43]KAI8361651.1 restriction endonuclease type II-like protein [Mortierella sp. GBAus27b]
MDKDTGKSTGPTNPPRLFRLPSRQEAEERRQQIDANSKPALLFKPQGIASQSTDTRSTTDATKSGTNLAAYANAIINDANSASKSLSGTSSRNNTKTTLGAGVGSSSSTSSSSTTKAGSGQNQSKANASDDDFDFGDDLELGDDIFDIEDDAPAKPQNPTAPPTSGAASETGRTAETSTSTSAAGAQNAPPPPPPPFAPKSKSTIVINSSQRGNPLLQFIRNVPYEYGEIVPDFAVGVTSCILFLSIRYHRLHPEYIFTRIAALGKSYVLRVLLILVDADMHQHAIRELTRIGMMHDLTVFCAWSNEEAARYIETFKAFENKAPDAIMERIDNDYLSKLTDSLTQVQSVNKTDVVTLVSTFGSLKNIMDASVDELGVLPGFGERKVKRLLEAFDQPFAIDPKKRKSRRN